MRQPSVSEMSHLILGWYLKDGSTALDATCGRGNDTLFLSLRCRKVYAFDIQEEAIESTKELCRGRSNILYFHADHSRLSEWIQEPLDAAVFNFGWLPGSCRRIRTTPGKSLSAVQQAMSLLKDGGMLTLCFYPHEEGEREKEEILSWVHQRGYLYSLYRTQVPGSPSLAVVSKSIPGQGDCALRKSTL